MGKARRTNTSCIICGTMLYNVPVTTKYCDACRPYELRKKKPAGPTLQEIMKEADKEGLQYASYCKKHGLY